MNKTSKAYTLSELKEMNKAFNQRIDGLKTDIEKTQQKIVALNNEMDAAANVGDVGLYKKLYAEKAELQTNAAAYDAILEQITRGDSTGFKNDDVSKAWAVWVEDFGEGFSTKVERFNALMEQCRKLYSEIAESYGTARTMRNEFAAFVSKDGFDEYDRVIPSGFKPIPDMPDDEYYFV